MRPHQATHLGRSVQRRMPGLGNSNGQSERGLYSLASKLPWSRPWRIQRPRTYATVSASELQFGQPVHETHPHILKPGELTPGITAQEYYNRRLKLAALLPRNSVAILPSAELKYRSGAVFFPFRQESNFLYLTGFAEQDSLAVIRKTGSDPQDHEFRLYVRPKDARAEQWSGPWSGVDAARDVWNADSAGAIDEAGGEVARLIRGTEDVFSDSPSYGGGNGGESAKPLAPLVHQLRAIKSPAEVANMRTAGRISGRVITDAMRRTWQTERDLALYLDHAFALQGCDGPAYIPVVAGGARGGMIHYVQNNAALDPNGMVLVDAGGEYGTYITDITRTWPLSGRFSEPQRELYEAVLRVQRTCVSLCRASAGFSLDRIHAVAEEGLRDQLGRLGFDFSGGSGGRGMGALFPHHIGHYVGLDVHDVPGYGRGITLQEGHCVTIEPGVYVPANDDRWPERYRGMAVRIEDSICVLDDSPLVLTTEAVKEVADIEALRQS